MTSTGIVMRMFRASSGAMLSKGRMSFEFIMSTPIPNAVSQLEYSNIQAPPMMTGNVMTICLVPERGDSIIHRDYVDARATLSNALSGSMCSLTRLFWTAIIPLKTVVRMNYLPTIKISRKKIEKPRNHYSYIINHWWKKTCKALVNFSTEHALTVAISR